MSDSLDASRSSWKEWVLAKLDYVAFLVVLSGSGGLLLIAFGTVLFQAAKYLKTGEWPDWSLLSVFADALPVSFIDWVDHPQDWFGLHKIVVWIGFNCPIALISLLLSAVWFFGGMNLLLWLKESLQRD